jgi:hypothetical protein
MNLVDNISKDFYQAAIDDIHDTFAREVFVWKEPKRTVVISNQDDFNYFYRNESQRAAEESFVQVTGAFPIRIAWIDPEKIISFRENEDIRPDIKGNMCRLKMKPDAYEFLKDSVKINVDSRDCEIVGFSKPHGLIDVKYVTMYLKEVN